MNKKLCRMSVDSIKVHTSTTNAQIESSQTSNVPSMVVQRKNKVGHAH